MNIKRELKKVKSLITKIAWSMVGGLSEPSKMPCFGYSIPHEACSMGRRLSKFSNSVCSKCYCKRGNYNFPLVASVLEKRRKSIYNPHWVDLMTFIINEKEHSGYFRWHDCGDLQNMLHLEKIVAIARALPHIKFWLPTKEIPLVVSYIKSGKTFPDNLTVRVSAFFIDTMVPKAITSLGLVSSSMSKTTYTCPAPNQDDKCNSCRACWDKNIFNVTYKYH